MSITKDSKNNFKVQKKGYFVVYNATKEREEFKNKFKLK